jgi:hypothetical protein
MGVEEAAEAILDIVNENMHAALRVVSVERGHDPREFGLVAFGGAGPMHACALGRLIRSRPVVVPPTPGVMSAFGFPLLGHPERVPRDVPAHAEETPASELKAAVEGLISQADAWLDGEGVEEDQRRFDLYADCRYYLQNIQIPCRFELDELSGEDSTFLRDRFEESHRQRYNFELPDSPLEIATVRVIGRGTIKGVTLSESANGAGGDSSGAVMRTEQAYFGGWVETPYPGPERAQAWQRGYWSGRSGAGRHDDRDRAGLQGCRGPLREHLDRGGVRRNGAERGSAPGLRREHDIDHVTLDIIENALKNIRHEMDRVLVTTAVSPVIREQADEFPLIADRKGRMIVGQFGSPVDTVLDNSPYKLEDLKDGDVIALNDPYMMEGSTSHLPDILLVRPIFHSGDHIGYALQWGNLMDVGGSTAGSIPIDARSIFEEGVRMPPVKLYDGGKLNDEVLRFFCHNSRTPRETRADVMAIAAGTATGAQRVKDICDRFGKDTYLEACDALLARTRTSIIGLIRQLIPEGQRFEFEDFTDDDGLGHGP